MNLLHLSGHLEWARSTNTLDTLLVALRWRSDVVRIMASGSSNRIAVPYRTLDWILNRPAGVWLTFSELPAYRRATVDDRRDLNEIVRSQPSIPGSSTGLLIRRDRMLFRATFETLLSLKLNIFIYFFLCLCGAELCVHKLTNNLGCVRMTKRSTAACMMFLCISPSWPPCSVAAQPNHSDRFWAKISGGRRLALSLHGY